MHQGAGCTFDLFAVHSAAQVISQFIAGTAQGGFCIGIHLPAAAGPHAVHIQQQLHAGIRRHGAVHLVAERFAVAGVHAAKAHGIKLVAAVVIRQVSVIVPQHIGNVAAAFQLGPCHNGVQVSAQVLVTKFGSTAVILNGKGLLHQAGIAVCIAGLPGIHLRQLHAVAAPAAGNGHAAVYQIHGRQQVAEINALPVGQFHGVHPLQIPQVRVCIGGVLFKFAVAGARRQLPDGRVIIPHTGKAQSQVNGVIAAVLFFNILFRQRLQAAQAVQRCFIVRTFRFCRQRQQHQQHQYPRDDPHHTAPNGFRNHTPPHRPAHAAHQPTL